SSDANQVTVTGTTPLTTKGDLLTRTSSANARQAVGTNNQILMADSAQTNGIKWTSAVTTKGDVWTYDTAPNRLAVGTDAQVLTASSAAATGLAWANLDNLLGINYAI